MNRTVLDVKLVQRLLDIVHGSGALVKVHCSFSFHRTFTQNKESHITKQISKLVMCCVLRNTELPHLVNDQPNLGLVL